LIRNKKIIDAFLLSLNIVLLNISLAIAILLDDYYKWNLQLSHHKIYYITFNLLWIILALATQLYEDYRFFKIVTKFIKVFIFYSLLIFGIILITEVGFSSQLLILLHLILYLGLLAFSIFLQHEIYIKFDFFHSQKRKVAIIGCGAVSDTLANFFNKSYSGYELIGYFGDSQSSEKQFPFLGEISSIPQFIQNNGIHEIYSTILPASDDKFRYMVQETEKNNVRIKFVLDFELLFNRKVNIEVFNDIPILTFRNEPLEQLSNRIKKRCFDIVLSILIIILLLSWLFPIIALLIKITSKGPVLFRQKRSGKNGVEFDCFKFRTMKLNERADETHALKNDDRVTPLGKILRKSSLDELPQFINVLNNDMSIIGPRPHMVKHTDEFSKVIDTYMIRHYIKPGITGWAQVNGYRGDATIESMGKRVEYDIEYLENWSFWFDFQILFQTVLLIVKGDKMAY